MAVFAETAFDLNLSCFSYFFLSRTEIGINCPIQSGKDPNDMPELSLTEYNVGVEQITASYSGPDSGLTSVRRSRLHLSAGPDIDFIDNQEQEVRQNPPMAQRYKCPKRLPGSRKSSNALEKPDLNIGGASAKDFHYKTDSNFENNNKDVPANSNPSILLDDALNDNNVLSDDETEMIAGIPVTNWGISNEHSYGASIR